MKNLGRSESDAGLQAVSLEVPPMTKSERLHRWADNLEMRSQLEENEDAAPWTGGEGFSTRADTLPLSIAFEDWAFRAEGLRSDRAADALAFFDLSEDEVRRVVGSFDGGGLTIPVAVAAERVRALADQAEATTSTAERRTRERRLRRQPSGFGAHRLLTAMGAAPARRARAENRAAPAGPRNPRQGQKNDGRRAARAHARS